MKRDSLKTKQRKERKGRKANQLSVPRVSVLISLGQEDNFSIPDPLEYFVTDVVECDLVSWNLAILPLES